MLRGDVEPSEEVAHARPQRARKAPVMLTYVDRCGSGVEAAVSASVDTSSGEEDGDVFEESGESENEHPKRTAKTLRRPTPGVREYACGRDIADAVCSPGSALRLAVDAWRVHYEEDGDTAVLALLNSVLRLAGVRETLDAADLARGDPPAVLSALQRLWASPEGGVGACVLSSGSVKRAASAARAQGEFWRRWAECALDASGERACVLADGALLPWLVCMSSSAYRGLRVSATLAAYGVAQGCCVLLARLGRQNEALAAVGQAGDVSSTIAAVEGVLCAVVDGVFAQRFRDVDARLRSASVCALGEWAGSAPGVFMDPAHLRYVGWALHDRESSVRVSALATLEKLASGGASARHALAPLLARFGARIIEIASRDVDAAVRGRACAVVAVLYRHARADGRDAWPRRADLSFALANPAVLSRDAVDVLVLYVCGLAGAPASDGAEVSCADVAAAIALLPKADMCAAERLVGALRAVVPCLRDAPSVALWVQSVVHSESRVSESSVSESGATLSSVDAALMLLEAVARVVVVFQDRVPDGTRAMCAAGNSASGAVPRNASVSRDDLHAALSPVLETLLAASARSAVAAAAVFDTLALLDASRLSADDVSAAIAGATDVLVTDDAACAAVRLARHVGATESVIAATEVLLARGDSKKGSLSAKRARASSKNLSNAENAQELRNGAQMHASYHLAWRAAATFAPGSVQRAVDHRAAAPTAAEERARLGLLLARSEYTVFPAAARLQERLALALRDASAVPMAMAAFEVSSLSPMGEDDWTAALEFAGHCVTARLSPGEEFDAVLNGALAAQAFPAVRFVSRALVNAPPGRDELALRFREMFVAVGPVLAAKPSPFVERAVKALTAAASLAARSVPAAVLFRAAVEGLCRAYESVDTSECGFQSAAPVFAALGPACESPQDLFVQLAGPPSNGTPTSVLEASLPFLLAAFQHTLSHEDVEELRDVWRSADRRLDSSLYTLICRAHYASSRKQTAEAVRKDFFGTPQFVYREESADAADAHANGVPHTPSREASKDILYGPAHDESHAPSRDTIAVLYQPASSVPETPHALRPPPSDYVAPESEDASVFCHDYAVSDAETDASIDVAAAGRKRLVRY